MTACGGKADVPNWSIFENVGLLRKCPLFSEADTQTTEISAKRRAADRGPPINTISMLSSDRLMKIAVGHQRDGQTF